LYSLLRAEADVVDANRVSSWRAGGLRRLLGLWPWLPLPFAGAYLVLLLVKFNQIVEATYLNSDAASAPVIGELFGGSPAHRQVFLGQLDWFSTLLFEHYLDSKHLALGYADYWTARR
jgi:hypothetical protein